MKSRSRWLTICAFSSLSLRIAGPIVAQHPSDSTPNIKWKQIGIGAAVLAATITLDAPMARDVHGTMSPAALRTARQFDRFGDLSGIGPIVGGLVLTGVVTGNHRLTLAAVQTLESVVLASAVVQGGKHLLGRVRPYRDPDLDATDFSFFAGDPAFPSGHSAAAFATATTLGDAIDRPWARVGLYALATGTAWARVAEEKHWLSDVVAGAAVGIASARFVSNRLNFFGMRAPRFIIGPRAVGMHWTF